MVEVNSALADQPELVNASPYGEAWMIKIRTSNNADLDQLLSAEEYERLTAEEAH